MRNVNDTKSQNKNTTICFNEDEMYIYDYFKKKGGKISTEMKRVLKDFVDNDGKASDFIVDERVSRIISGIIGCGINPGAIRFEAPEMVNQTKDVVEDLAQEEPTQPDNLTEENFDLPPQNIALGIFSMTGNLDDNPDISDTTDSI